MRIFLREHLFCMALVQLTTTFLSRDNSWESPLLHVNVMMYLPFISNNVIFLRTLH